MFLDFASWQSSLAGNAMPLTLEMCEKEISLVFAVIAFANGVIKSSLDFGSAATDTFFTTMPERLALCSHATLFEG